MTEVIIAHYHFPSESTGRTKHVTSAGIEKDFDELRIVRYGPKEYNLLYFRGGIEVADTGHGSLEEALAQANFEFDISEKSWTLVS